MYGFDGRIFSSVCRVEPERRSSGTVVRYLPQAHYANPAGLALNQYGGGPFCRFSIPAGWRGKTGVYVFIVDGVPRYVGECENLERRIKMGYGNISPRNCYTSGQPTNCRINNLILQMIEQGSTIELVFHETERRHELEGRLLQGMPGLWNRKGPSSPPRTGTRHGVQPRDVTAMNKRSAVAACQSCREAVIAAARAITGATGVNRFTVQQIVDHLAGAGSPYAPATIRTHVTSICCTNAPQHHPAKYDDFERLRPGTYRIISQIDRDSVLEPYHESGA